MTATVPDRVRHPVRRHILGLMASLPVVGRATPGFAAAAAKFPDSATLLTAGPEDGSLERWAHVVQPALARNLPPGTAVRRVSVGGADGVTGANQFEARAEPDGKTALLVPGDAALAWMVGDPRARYDVGRWVTILTGVTSGILVGRDDAIAPGRTVRIATAGPASRDLPALLALDMLGANTELLPKLTPDGAAAAMGRGALDAIFVCGHNVPAHVAALRALGGQPVLALGMVDEIGQRIRDPGFPDTPLLDELTHGGEMPIRAAFSAAAMAVQTEFLLVVRQLTPAAMVAQWRSAGAEAMAAPDVQAFAQSLTVRTVAGAAASAASGAAAADQSALLELRRWLAGRYGWKPT